MITLQDLLEKVEVYFKKEIINLYSYLSLESIKVNTVENREELKRKMLEKVIAIMCVIQMNEDPLEIVNERYRRLKEAYKSMGYSFKLVEAKLLHRGLVGTGEGFGRLAFEVGLSWDPTLQLPFFPGSSIKGATRVIAEAVASGEEDIEVEIEGKEIRRIFGFSEKEGAGIGSIIFHDAYPVEPNEEGLILEPDVMTPIYKDHIEEHKASPIPIPFLAIAQGVKFYFLLASKDRGDLNKAIECLKRALEYGVGAKTLIGYSVFTEIKVK